MSVDEKTIDTKRISLSVEKFIIVIFSVATLSGTVSGIVSSISRQEGEMQEETRARRTNDAESETHLVEVRRELEEEDEEIREDIAELKERFKEREKEFKEERKFLIEYILNGIK